MTSIPSSSRPHSPSQRPLYRLLHVYQQAGLTLTQLTTDDESQVEVAASGGILSASAGD